jgi:peptide/nickel transport system substrate-binding protein
MSALARIIVVTAVSAAAVFSSPYASAESVLRHVPQADLKILDPVTNTAFITMQYSFMVYDQLFSMDETYKPHPQMVESYTVSDDKKTYRFTLRPGLKFHDGSPVRAADAAASVKRWAMKDPAGGKMAALGMKLDVVDDHTFTLSLNEPFGPVLESMAKPSWALFVMPEKEIANRPVSEAVTSANGSGPFRLVRSEWVPGAKIVFERNPDYVSRSEPADFFSGGKVVKVDRVEWDIMSDLNTAVSALMAGEVDSIENIPIEQVPILKRDKNIVVAVHNKSGTQGFLRPNHLYPPFNDPKGREALVRIVNQEDFMRAAIGDPTYWQVCWAWLMCGSPTGSEAGAEAFRKPDPEKAKQLLKEAGYQGEKIVVMDATGLPYVHEMNEVLLQELRGIGLNLEVMTMEWSTMLTRRASSEPPDKGGWNMYIAWAPGLDVANPLASYELQAPCTKTSWAGWACDQHMEALRDAWARETDPVKRNVINENLQQEAIKMVGVVPLGQFYIPTAYRTSLKGFLAVPLPVMWNVEKKE